MHRKPRGADAAGTKAGCHVGTEATAPAPRGRAGDAQVTAQCSPGWQADRQALRTYVCMCPVPSAPGPAEGRNHSWTGGGHPGSPPTASPREARLSLKGHRRQPWSPPPDSDANALLRTASHYSGEEGGEGQGGRPGSPSGDSVKQGCPAGVPGPAPAQARASRTRHQAAIPCGHGVTAQAPH